MTRKQYSKEFKLDAISLVLEQDYSRAEAARSLGINANMLGRWVNEHKAEEGQAFRGNGKLTPEQEEIRKLKTQVKRLEMERDILKNVWSAPGMQGSNWAVGNKTFASMYPAC
jgi:transposase